MKALRSEITSKEPSSMTNLWQDIRYAMRQLRKSPDSRWPSHRRDGAIFRSWKACCCGPCRFRSARLVVLGDNIEGADFGGGMPYATSTEIAQYTRNTRSFSSVGAYRQTGYELSGTGEPTQIGASRLTASIFPTLGVSPLMGRTFTQQEDDGSQQVAVLSYSMWRSRFHGDQNFLGKKIQLDRKTYEIIGVMPRDFEFPLVPAS